MQIHGNGMRQQFARQILCFPTPVLAKPPRAGILLIAALVCFVPVANSQAAQNPVAPIVSALRSHDFTQALSLSRSALAADPKDYRLWTLQGMATAGTGDLRGALVSYQHALQLQSEYLPALEGAAQTEFQLGQDARPQLNRILTLQPADPVSHLMLGILDYRRNDCGEALANFGQAGAALPSHAEGLMDEGVCLVSQDRFSDAAAAFRQALTLQPSSHAARYNLALAQFSAHDTDAALQTLQPMTEGTPPHADALALAAQIAESKGDTAQAVTLLRNAILADPKDVDAYLQFATLSFDHASPKVGIDIVNAGIGQLPDEPRLLLVRGILFAQMGEFTLSADDFEAANRLDPQLQFLGVAQGLVQSQEHNAPQALVHFRAAVKAHPGEAYAWYLLAEALSVGGYPEGSPEHNEELQALKTAVNLDPKLIEAHDLLSAVYYSGGHMEQSIEQSRAALAQNPKDESALYHLMLALRKTGHDDEARTLVQQLVQLRTESKTNQPPERQYHLYEPSGPGVAVNAASGPQ